jgi:murein DD-endopeptidase MepM/ murein hydrolase activator NlpD
MFIFSKSFNILFLVGFIFSMSLGSLPIGYSYASTENTTPSVQQYNTGNYELEIIEKERFYISTDMGWPVEDIVVSSGWGHRESCDRCSSFHKGLDFTPGRGEAVIASMNGTVKEIGNGGEYGVYVILEHLVNGANWETVYAHLQTNSVPKDLKIGQEIFIGDRVGAVGETGLTTGPHLHFEVRINGIKKNPWPILMENTKQS